MYKIVKKKELTDNIFLMDIEAPRVAKSSKPGQFIIIKNDDKGERIPLTIADYNKDAGTVSIVFQAVGRGTKELASFNEGEYVSDFVGPLGQPSEFIYEDIEELKKKNILFVAGGVGAAPVYPQVKWMKENGINCDVIVGSRTKDLLILEDELKNNVYGQNEAIKEVARCIKTSRAGLNDENKPVASMLFVGPTGVGKTEIAKVLSKTLGIELVRFDMSEYGEKHVSSLISKYYLKEHGEAILNSFAVESLADNF